MLLLRPAIFFDRRLALHMYFLYSVLMAIGMVLLAPYFALQGLRRGKYLASFRQRMGHLPQALSSANSCPSSIWVHAVSVGEVLAAKPLIDGLKRCFPARQLFLSTTTATGQRVARERIASADGIFYFPFDWSGTVRRDLNQLRPALVVILETEIWPNLYHRCGRLGIPLVMASARISPRSVTRYRRLVGLFREALSHGIFIAAQSEQDAERFRSIGASPERTHVVGNIKFDFSLPPNIEAQGATLRRLLGMDRPVWVAGSTHSGEEDILLAAHRSVRARFGL